MSKVDTLFTFNVYELGTEMCLIHVPAQGSVVTNPVLSYGWQSGNSKFMRPDGETIYIYSSATTEYLTLT